MAWNTLQREIREIREIPYSHTLKAILKRTFLSLQLNEF